MSKNYIAKEVKASVADKYYPNDTSWGTLYYCRLGASNGWVYRAFLQHDFSGVPYGSSIVSAKLYVYACNGGDNVSQYGCKFDTILNDWDESTLSWNNQPSLANTLIPADWVAPTIGTWNSWDITEIAQKWANGELVNNGLALVNNNESGYRVYFDIYNKRHSEGEYATYIEVEYEEGQQYSITERRLQDLANSIRAKTGEEELLTVADMVKAVNSIENISVEGLQMDLLWENASPTSAFAGQTIEVDLSPYELYMVIFRNSPTYDIHTVQMAIVGHGTMETFTWADSGGYGHRSATSTISGITFNNGWYNKASDNNNIIPIRIYGIKGVN